MAPILSKQDGQVPTMARSSNRTITSKMSPGVASTPYWKIIAGQNDSIAPEPVLSIIQLKLLPGYSVLTTSPAARLWTASLEYISTIPGCVATHWGTRKFSDKGQPKLRSEKLCLLIAWESSRHWAKFQDSFGLLLMREILAKDEGISNRCVQISLPHLSHSWTSLKLASFRFASKVSEQKRNRFAEQFAVWRNDRAVESVDFCGTWLEGDAVWPTPNLVSHRLAVLERSQSELRSSQDRIFVVLMFEHNSMTNMHSISTEGTLKIGGHTGTTESFSLVPQIVKVDSYFDIKSSNLPAPQTLASLLFHNPQRKYSSNSGMSHNIDQIHETTVQDFYNKNRLFPGPRGEMRMKMGDMCEYGSRYSDNATAIEEVVVEIVEFEIEKDVFEFGGDRKKEGSMRQLFLDFKLRVSEMDGCEEMYWARAEDGAGCVAIIYWTSSVARMINASPIYQLKQGLIATLKLLKERPETPGHKAQYSEASGIITPAYTTGTSTPLSMTGHVAPSIISTTTILSSLRTRQISKSPRVSFPLLEITTFELMDEPQTLALFKVFYNAFQMTSSLNARVVTQAIPLACNTSDYTLTPTSLNTTTSLSTPPSTPPNGTTKILFTALIGWKSLAAMAEWYSSFHSPSSPNYERLGHKIDALCSLGLENIQTRIMTVTNDVIGARRTVMWEGVEGDGEKDRARKRRNWGGSLFSRSSMGSPMGSPLGSPMGSVLGSPMRRNVQRDKKREREKRLSTLSQWTSKGS